MSCTRIDAAVGPARASSDPTRALQGVTLKTLTRELLAALKFGLSWKPTDMAVVAFEQHGPDGRPPGSVLGTERRRPAMCLEYA